MKQVVMGLFLMILVAFGVSCQNTATGSVPSAPASGTETVGTISVVESVPSEGENVTHQTGLPEAFPQDVLIMASAENSKGETQKNDGREVGILVYQTAAPLAEVVDFYLAAGEQLGATDLTPYPPKEEVTDSWSCTGLVDGKTITFSVYTANDKTQVSVTY